MDETQQVPDQAPVTPVPPITTYPIPQPAPTGKTPWVFITVIVILLGVASYFGYQNYQLKQQLTAQAPTPTPATTVVNSPTPTSTPIPTSDPTANWKTYAYTENGFNFSFKYPTIFNPKGTPSISWVSPIDKTIVEISIEFTSTEKDKSNNLVLYISKNGESSLENYVSKNTDSNFTPPVTTVGELGNTIDWFDFYRNIPAHYLSFTKNNYVYSFGLVDFTGLPEDDAKDSKILTQILSTFKFAE